MTQPTDIVAVSAVRTPLGRFGGAFRNMLTYELGARAMKEAIARSGFRGDDLDEVVFGCCRQAGNGPNPARTAALLAKIPARVPSNTINMACPSGMKTVILAAQGILSGQGTAYLTGGMESMSTIPHLLKNARFTGFKRGDITLEDGWSDSVDPITGMSMGLAAEHLARKHSLSRARMDEYAAESHRRALQATADGLFDEEIVPVEIPDISEEANRTVGKDEGPRQDATSANLARLPSAFTADGSITAGNSCTMSDGACALVITTREAAAAEGARPLFSILSHASTAVDGLVLGEGPGESIPAALRQGGFSTGDMDLYEINEAFAAQVLVNVEALNLDLDKLNVNGGAIALGHPTGISGARILVTLYSALKQRDKELGVAAVCGGGGVTTAMVIKREL